MELSTEDKERIEQEGRKIASYVLGFPPEEILPDDSVLFGATKGAEYATIYERQQQANLKAEYDALCERTREPLANEEDLHKYRNALTVAHEREKKLEAERSELRNKVISAMEELKRMKMMKDDIENEIEQLKIIDDLLNSLKTK